MFRIFKFIKNWWLKPYFDAISHSPAAPMIIMLLLAGCGKQQSKPVFNCVETENFDRRPVQQKSAFVKVEFDGFNLNDPVFGTRYLAPYSGQQQPIITTLCDAFSGWDITFTTDDNIYKRARNKAHRVRLIITPTNWQGGVSGLANTGSMTRYDDSKCFVFSNVLYNIPDMIGRVAVHEVGHTIGLGHQADYYDSCRLQNTYGVDKFMGWAAQASNPQWFNQPYCRPQNDTAIINSVIR